MARRQITEDDVAKVLVAPEQTAIIREGREVYQSRFQTGEPTKTYLLRVFVDVDRTPPRSGNDVSNKQGCEVLEDRNMKVIYDLETDTLTIIFAETPVAESDEDKPGVILDYDASGNLVSLEILDASRRVTLPSRIEYQVAPMSG